MEAIIWMVILFYVGRRWLKKNPERAAALKKVLQESQAGKHPDLAKIIATKPDSAPSPSAATPEKAKPAHTAGTLYAATTKPHQPAKLQKKPEKQFQEL